MWWWVLIWGLVLAWAGVYLGTRAWGVLGRLKAFGRELAEAERRLDEVQGQLDLLGERIGSPGDLALFGDKTALRAQDKKDRAAASATRKRRQRAKARPAWAKHVD